MQDSPRDKDIAAESIQYLFSILSVILNDDSESQRKEWLVLSFDKQESHQVVDQTRRLPQVKKRDISPTKVNAEASTDSCTSSRAPKNEFSGVNVVCCM